MNLKTDSDNLSNTYYQSIVLPDIYSCLGIVICNS